MGMSGRLYVSSPVLLSECFTAPHLRLIYYGGLVGQAYGRN